MNAGIINRPDIIKDASETLKPVSDRGITVVQGWYDENIKECHVTLWDLGEEETFYSDDEPECILLYLQVTIFSQNDEVELARDIKELMRSNDFIFEGRNGDDSQPEDGIYMKAQRFSKFYDYESED